MKNKYNKSSIYCLKSASTNKIYIGSTTTSLYFRFKKHKEQFLKWYYSKNVHEPPNIQLLKFRDCEICLIESCSFQTKEELLQREQLWINTYPQCTNTNKSIRTEPSTLQILFEE